MGQQKLPLLPLSRGGDLRPHHLMRVLVKMLKGFGAAGCHRSPGSTSCPGLSQRCLPACCSDLGAHVSPSWVRVTCAISFLELTGCHPACVLRACDTVAPESVAEDLVNPTAERGSWCGGFECGQRDPSVLPSLQPSVCVV